jgi:transposase
MDNVFRYYDLLRSMKNPYDLRLKMVKYAEEHGNKPTARVFDSTVKTVRKWVRRYDRYKLEGLNSLSRAPKSCPHKTLEELEKRIVKLRKKLPYYGAARLKRDFDIPCSKNAIHRILRDHNLVKKRRKKHKRKKDLRQIKERYRLFEQISVDTKYLNDIPNYWPQMRRMGLPRYQYTARDVRSGMLFLGYSTEHSAAYACQFAEIISYHLRHCGVDLAFVSWQTDNGIEFIGGKNSKGKRHGFGVTVERFGAIHRRIPPRAYTYQSDVETVHRLIEDEFFHIESFSSMKDFIHKASSYLLFFNLARKNSYKHNKTPLEIAKEINPNVDTKIALLRPIFFDILWGYDVPGFP